MDRTPPTVLAERVATAPDAFEPKDRWAMDWYYPVLTGTLTGEPAKARLAEGWDTFAMEGKGIRCVSDEAWVTASETAECSIAHAVIGDRSTATDLLAWTRAHRRADGGYWTGNVYPEPGELPARRGVGLHRRRSGPRRRRDHRGEPCQRRVRRRRVTVSPPLG